MNSQELRALQEAYNQVYAPQELDEAEGSYGQTPKAQQKMGDLANKRRNTPASEYSERGEKKKKVDSASRHFNRMGNPDAGNKGKKSSRPYYPAGRKGMTQKDRDWSRGADEYGHSGYDGEGGGGSLPKGKKLERQKKTGVSESFDLFDYILEYLVAEGYADTNESALVIMANMSEEWREDIMEISQKTATTVYGTRRSSEFDGDDGPDRIKNTNKLRDRIEKKFGDEAVKNADAHADSRTFGRTDSRTGKRQERPQSRTQRPNKYRTRADGKMHGQAQNTLKANLQKRRPSDSDN
jgi:hypothetical protein